MSEAVARFLTTTVIWGATAYIFVSGLCTMNWSGLGSVIVWVCAIVGFAAASGTTAVWRVRPISVPGRERVSCDQQSADRSGGE